MSALSFAAPAPVTARSAARVPSVAAFLALRAAGVSSRSAARSALVAGRAVSAPPPAAPAPVSGVASVSVPPLAPTARIVLCRETSPKKDPLSVSGLAWEAYKTEGVATVADYLALRTLPDGSVFPKGKAAAALRFDLARGYVRLEG
jgi:hypothetical protein